MSQFQFLLSEILEAAAPELQASPLYLVELDESIRIGPSYALAITSIFPIPQLESRLKREGRWTGDGSIIGLYPERIRAEVGEARHLFGQTLRQTLAHELCHLLPYKKPLSVFSDEPTDQEIEHIEAVVEKAERKRPKVKKRPLPWDLDHGYSFIRRACHVWWRCQQAGIRFSVDGMFAGQTYALSIPEHYLAEIGDEPARMKNDTFQEILNTPPPKSFWELWQHDVNYYAELRAEYDRPPNEEKRA